MVRTDQFRSASAAGTIGGPGRIRTYDQQIISPLVITQKIRINARNTLVSTTPAHYILPERKYVEAGLKKLGAVAQKKYGIKV
jgi:hypothetical protein